MDARLPTHIEVSGLIRAVEAAGGSAMVLQKGERDAGTLALISCHRGNSAQLWERMPQLDGSRVFINTRSLDPDNPMIFWDYIDRRKGQDRDMWLVELDVENPERFIA